MTVKECCQKNLFNPNRVEQDMRNGLVTLPPSVPLKYSIHQYAFLCTLNWAKKTRQTELFFKQCG